MDVFVSILKRLHDETPDTKDGGTTSTTAKEVRFEEIVMVLGFECTQEICKLILSRRPHLYPFVLMCAAMDHPDILCALVDFCTEDLAVEMDHDDMAHLMRALLAGVKRPNDLTPDRIQCAYGLYVRGANPYASCDYVPFHNGLPRAARAFLQDFSAYTNGG